MHSLWEGWWPGRCDTPSLQIEDGLVLPCICQHHCGATVGTSCRVIKMEKDAQRDCSARNRIQQHCRRPKPELPAFRGVYITMTSRNSSEQPHQTLVQMVLTALPGCTVLQTAPLMEHAWLQVRATMPGTAMAHTCAFERVRHAPQLTLLYRSEASCMMLKAGATLSQRCSSGSARTYPAR